MNENPVSQSLDDLARQVAPGSSIAGSVMTRIAEIQMQSARNDQTWRWIMRSAIGVAACVAIAFTYAFFFTQPRVAFADVIDKINQTHTLTFTVNDPEGPIHVIHVFNRPPDGIRFELSNGLVSIQNKATVLTLDAQKHEATVATFARQPLDFYAWFKDYKTGKAQHIGEKTIDGKRLQGFKVIHTLPDSSQSTFTLWIDPVSDLPVEAQISKDGHDVKATNFQFDVPLSDALFDMTIPKDYKVTDFGGIPTDQLKPAPTTKEADSLTIVPNVGVGALHFGASRAEVIKLLGPPESSANKFNLGYPSKGFFLLVHPKLGLMSITLMSKKSFGPFAGNSFPGHTAKNIGMDSTRAQIEAAYGPPSSVKNYAKTMSMLEYDSLNVTFTLSNNQVVEMLLQEPHQAGD